MSGRVYTAADAERERDIGLNGSGVGPGPGFLEACLDETSYVESRPDFYRNVLERAGSAGETNE